MLEDRGLTLPPETYPLRGFARSGQVNWQGANSFIGSGVF